MSELVKLIEVDPTLGLIALDQLVHIHIKTIPGLIADEQPQYRRGKKIRKRWYVSELDRVLNKPAFCKEYEYSISIDGKLTTKTTCIWFDLKDEVIIKKVFENTISKGSSDFERSKFRQIMVSLLKTDAGEIPGLDGKALNIFKRYKDQIENYYEFESAKQDWIDAMENETDAEISALLEIELPVYYVGGIYEEALTQERLMPILFGITGLFPFNNDGTSKTAIEIGQEFGALGVDLQDMSSILQYLGTNGVDARVISIKQIITELLTSD